MHAYGIPINNFSWTIDKGTVIEPIDEVDPPESSLPPPTQLTLTMFEFNINAITEKTQVWTTKEHLSKALYFGGDIRNCANLFIPFHTYLVSVTYVKESRNAYGIPINNFTWAIDKGTVIEPIEEFDPLESSLPPPTRLTLTMFEYFEHQPEGSKFDILAFVVNIGLPTYTNNGSRIQESIIMDNQKKPKNLTLLESFIDHDGVQIAEQLDQYPIILARKVGKSKSSARLTTRFSTIILINPPCPQVVALSAWA
ncbi:hypothetical protein H5410_036211 [Solanum commersonii]|uniref:Uncharacterized protein n=1 Tax=Solanum commersonii TaxID=4109 RepID=A0A9J5Y2Y0_SOLCO|nr:hypothetical protein H5410_036211 [Solanum commersonii]